MSSVRITMVAALVCTLLATPAAAGAQEREITLITHDSFAVSEEVLAEFFEESGVTVEILRAGDAGSMLNQAIITKDNPLADVLFGVDNTFLSRALDAGIFEPYESPLLDRVPAGLRVDPEHRVTPIDFGDVCLNWDRGALGAEEVPERLIDLTEPEYRGMLVVENPATSSPGLAFLLATIATFGEEGDYTWQDYWADLRDNDVLVTSGWEEAYYTAFTPYGGDRPLVVSYASSPPAEVFFAEEPLEEAPTGVITDGCFRQVEYAGILAGTAARPEAEMLVDFMLSDRFQEDIPLNMFVFPASSSAELPEVFRLHTSLPTDPVSVDPAAIGANRDRWIEEWDEVMRGGTAWTTWLGIAAGGVLVAALIGLGVRRRTRSRE